MLWLDMVVDNSRGRAQIVRLKLLRVNDLATAERCRERERGPGSNSRDVSTELVGLMFQVTVLCASSCKHMELSEHQVLEEEVMPRWN